ncbi:MAG TPA: hypothetical protein VFO98_09205 [Marmoricola sp.]|jgi:DNA-directed RNA polymerase specialized sigma24 family protein|nr:hypothetical protein [Marmoricola sp.]
MPSAEEFDEFYVESRRRLLLQAFALTGDLGAARSAVRDAYVAARHHWAKVGRLPDPETWVRPRAWTTAQRRHSARPWHREKGLTESQTAVLEALQGLPDGDRKALLLTHLAAAPMDQIGQEIGVTRERAEQHLQAATAATALALDIDSTGIRAALGSLEGAIAGARLPRAPIIRRSGVRRRRVHAVVASVALVLTTVGAGALVVERPADHVDRAVPAAVEQAQLVPRTMLLDPGMLAGLAPGRQWTTVTTNDNTGGDGINSLCQVRRFADERGLGTWVRTLRSTGKPAHRLTETVEISASEHAARAAYDTTVGWFAGCTNARIQLLSAYGVPGVGDEAQLLLLRIPGPAAHAYVVGVARTGKLTVSTLVETRGAAAPERNRAMHTLALAVQGVCGSEVAGQCIGTPRLAPVLPPASGEGPGMLAVADLPALEHVRGAWVGTDPAPTRGAIAATTCDRTDFTRAGALKTRSRTFLIPRSKLPARFGMTETVGEFASVAKARAFLHGIEREMSTCSRTSLASKVTVSHVVPRAWRGSEYALWRLENQVNNQEHTVGFWMGAARVGRHVMQVTFTPAPQADVDEQSFRALVTRARDRLYELEPPKDTP